LNISKIIFVLQQAYNKKKMKCFFNNYTTADYCPNTTNSRIKMKTFNAISNLLKTFQEDEEQLEQKMDKYMKECFTEFKKDNNETNCVLMYYDADKNGFTMRIVDKITLCDVLYDILTVSKIQYDNNQDYVSSCEYFTSSQFNDLHVLEFLNTSKRKDREELDKIRFVCKNVDMLAIIDGLLKLCRYKDDLNEFLQTIQGEKNLVDCFNKLLRDRKMTKVFVKHKNIDKKQRPREEIPREEIPREKTLSKKEKEKLKKQKAKEANKLKQQEKKDKAKLAEQQAKQFEKQQKERERKRIETARKKKLALLKK
jgi:hypothetical protein